MLSGVEHPCSHSGVQLPKCLENPVFSISTIGPNGPELIGSSPGIKPSTPPINFKGRDVKDPRTPPPSTEIATGSPDLPYHVGKLHFCQMEISNKTKNFPNDSASSLWFASCFRNPSHGSGPRASASAQRTAAPKPQEDFTQPFVSRKRPKITHAFGKAQAFGIQAVAPIARHWTNSHPAAYIPCPPTQSLILFSSEW